MFTDMVGYTSSTQTDEARTLELLQQQQELVRPLIAAHHGREIKSTGDGFLVEFDSALRATQCAIDIQRRIYERNAQTGLVPIQIRIGIHLGDVEQKGADILGDAVNIAARIEPIAEPGGVCVSGAVREQVWNKIPDKLEKLPPQALKGLQISMDIYRVVLPVTGREPALASTTLTGIAVLPFTNISPDPNDEYFADGLTEELITVLSRLRELRVISRTSVMQYKATSKSVTQIGTELAVVSILEGSVRKAGSRLRVTAQLIDARSDRHLWAETYDRELNDIFAVQAEIARQVAEALKVELGATEEARLEARRSVRPDSYLAYLKGRTLQHSPSKVSLEAAKEQFELAISLDSHNAAAHAGLAMTLGMLGIWYTEASQTDWVEHNRGLAIRAIELDPNLAEAHLVLAMMFSRDYERNSTEKEVKLALSLDPSFALAHFLYAQFLANELRVDDALREFALAEAADPIWTHNLWVFAWFLALVGRLDEALVKLQKVGESEPSAWMYHSGLARYYLARSDLEHALKEIREYEERTTEPRWKPVIRAWGYALSGEKEKSRALLRLEETLPEFGQIPLTAAVVCAELGDLDECFRWLDKGFRSHNLPIWIFRLDPRTARARGDPRFQALLKKMKLA